MKKPTNLNCILVIAVMLFSLNAVVEANWSKLENRNHNSSDQPTRENEEAILQKSAELFSAVRSGVRFDSGQPDLTDFRNKTQRGLDFMNKGSSIRILKCEMLTDWSESISNSLASYLQEIYKDNKEINSEQDRVKSIVNGLKENQSHPGIMYWEIDNSGKIEIVNSIVFFDDKWNVLYDTKLASFIMATEDITEETDGPSPNQTEVIQNQVSQTRSRVLLYEGLFGSLELFYEARVTAIVSPYITASTNDAEYNYFTNHISCYPRNPSGFPPNPPFGVFLFFGTGGTYTTFFANSVPAKSPISVTGGDSTDRFNTGLYTISGSNGQNWSFDFDFSVDFPGGGIGITPVSNISSLSLSANSNRYINLLNYRYIHNTVTSDVRALFYTGGSLNADNFKILTGSGAGETGRIDIASKLQVGYLYFDVLGIWHAHFYSETSSSFNPSVRYLRGDHVLQPSYQLTSTRYNMTIGQIDTLKAKIINNSHAVKLNGGNVSIDVSSLNGMLTVLSPATLSIGSIDTSASKEFKFVVQGNANGIVTPQVNISAMGWSSPVPPSILINNIASIDSNIDVSPLIKTLTLTAPIQGFYNPQSNTMISDTARVFLRNAASPYNIVDSAKSYLNTSCAGTFSFTKAVNFTPYYIQFKHRNSIETWSKTTQFFIISELNYDFSSAATQAYGDNLMNVDQMPEKYAIYGGDVNQNGSVDAQDLTIVDNDAFNFVTGYVNSDVTGNNITDAADLTIVDNNAFNFVGKIAP